MFKRWLSSVFAVFGYDPFPEPKPTGLPYALPKATVTQDLPATADVRSGAVANPHGLFTADPDGQRRFVPPSPPVHPDNNPFNMPLVGYPSTGPNAYGPGHPDWHGRAELPLIESGWAVPGHPLYFYQQVLKHQNEGTTPKDWKVVGWTPEGVSYAVPEAYWTDAEKRSPFVVVRSTNSPHASTTGGKYRTPDQVHRDDVAERADTENRIALFEAHVQKTNAAAAKILADIRSAAEAHARTKLDNDSILSDAVEGNGSADEKVKRIEEWVKLCGQRAVNKRIDDSVKSLYRDSMLAGIPTDAFIYAAPDA